MIVHPAIAALQPSLTSQRRTALAHAQAMERVKAGWLAQAQVQAIREDLRRYSDGAALDDCAALAAVMRDHCTARRFVDDVCATMLDALRKEPLSEVPFRYTISSGLAILQLLKIGNARLALSAYEPLATDDAPETVLFADREMIEMVVSGHGRGLFYTMQRDGQSESQRDGALRTAPTVWQAGASIAVRPVSEARQIVTVKASLVLLQLIREPAAPAPTREVSTSDGKTVRIASGDKSASQAVMALGVLGALGECRSLVAMADTALNRREDMDVRWEAVRQTLALDAARGMALLETLAARSNEPLNHEATRLKQSLLAAQPELRALAKEPARCL